MFYQVYHIQYVVFHSATMSTDPPAVIGTLFNIVFNACMVLSADNRRREYRHGTVGIMSVPVQCIGAKQIFITMVRSS